MIGLDLSDKSVKIVETKGNNTPVLRTLCWAPVNPSLLKRGVVRDVALVTEAVNNAMARCSPVLLEGRNVVASIPEVQSFVRVLEVPAMSNSEMNEAVQWAVRRHIPFDLDRVYIDWEALDIKTTTPQNKQILVGAAQKDVIDPLLAVLDNLGLNVVALELEAQAVMRCLLPGRSEDSKNVRGVLVIDLGATSTNVVLYDQGAMRFTTNVQFGGDDLTRQLAKDLKLNAKEALAMKEKVGVGFGQADENVAKALRNAALSLAHMIERAVQEMTVQLPPEQHMRIILITGGGANLTGIKELFGSVFEGIPVQLGNPWTNLQPAGKKAGINISVGDAMHFTTAIGLALREADFK